MVGQYDLCACLYEGFLFFGRSSVASRSINRIVAVLLFERDDAHTFPDCSGLKQTRNYK